MARRDVPSRVPHRLGDDAVVLVRFGLQVFEANIRMLGGLISAHLIAKDPDFGMQNDDYDDELLWLARDLAGRLLPAFENTPCGIPHPRVNLRFVASLCPCPARVVRGLAPTASRWHGDARSTRTPCGLMNRASA